jgi:hypothetical protein
MQPTNNRAMPGFFMFEFLLESKLGKYTSCLYKVKEALANRYYETQKKRCAGTMMILWAREDEMRSSEIACSRIAKMRAAGKGWAQVEVNILRMQ